MNYLCKICFLSYLMSVVWMSVVHAQVNDRNEQVRSLNMIVTYMDEASRINQQVYFDIVTFARAYKSNTARLNNNAWSVSVSPDMRLKSSDLSSYEGIHPDAEGFINDYESKLLSFIRIKQDSKTRLNKFPVKNVAVIATFKVFAQTTDSMLYHYKAIVEYVHQKKFLADDKHIMAKQLMENLQVYFEKYNRASKALYEKIQEYYIKSLTPLKNQVIIRTAQQELLYAVNVMDKWTDELYKGDDSHRAFNDSTLRALNKSGRPKSATYLEKTYGYNHLSNGAYPHSRYDMFYAHMPATIFWYKSDTAANSNEKFLSREQNNYNKYVNRYNSVIEYYNKFIECADGRAFARNMDYSVKMAGEIGADTAQNVLLKKPRITYQFTYLDAAVEKKEESFVQLSDTASLRRRGMIRAADPHHTVYLLDVSNSMKEEHKLDTLKEGVNYLVSLQREVDMISVIAFADSAEAIIRFTPCDQKDIIVQRINKLQTNGATNAEDALRDGYRLVDSTLQYKGITKVLIITDGLFTLEKPMKKKIEYYQKLGVHLSILLLGRIHDLDTLEYFQELCKKGNGNFYDLRFNNLREVLVKEAVNE